MSDAKKRRIVIVGKMGSGKSSLGNNLLRTGKFVARDSFNSVTECCCTDTKPACDEHQYDITIVDTPGLFQPTNEKSMAKQALEISESLNSTCNPHAFLLVIRNDCRWSPEDKSTKEALEIIFGPELFKHTIVVITHVNNTMTGTEFEDKWKSSKDLVSLINSCDTRVARIDNTELNDCYRADILDYVERVSKNGSKSYSYGFQDCNKRILESIIEFEKYDTKIAHEQVRCIARDIKEAVEFEQRMSELNRRNKEIEQRVTELNRREEATNDRETDLDQRERKIEKMLQQEMDKINEWKRTAEENINLKEKFAKAKEVEGVKRILEAEQKENVAEKKEKEAEKIGKEAKQKVQKAKQQEQKAEQKAKEAELKEQEANRTFQGTLVATVVTGVAAGATGGIVPALGYGLIKAGCVVSSMSMASFVATHVVTHVVSTVKRKLGSKPDTESEKKNS